MKQQRYVFSNDLSSNLFINFCIFKLFIAKENLNKPKLGQIGKY